MALCSQVLSIGQLLAEILQLHQRPQIFICGGRQSLFVLQGTDMTSKTKKRGRRYYEKIGKKKGEDMVNALFELGDQVPDLCARCAVCLKGRLDGYSQRSKTSVRRDGDLNHNQTSSTWRCNTKIAMKRLCVAITANA